MESPSPVRGPHTVETVGGPPAHTYDGYHIDREVARRRTLENYEELQQEAMRHRPADGIADYLGPGSLRNESKENDESKDQCEMETEKIRKLKRASVPKGDRKSRSARDMSLRFGSGRIRSYFCKGMKVRARGESEEVW